MLALNAAGKLSISPSRSESPRYSYWIFLQQNILCSPRQRVSRAICATADWVMQTQSLPGCKTSSTPPPPHRDNFLSSLPLPIYLASKKKPITVHRQCCVTADQWRLWQAGIGCSLLSKWFPMKLGVKANICQKNIQIVLFSNCLFSSQPVSD